MKKVILIVTFLAFAVFGNSVFAYDYNINGYNVDIKVGQDNVLGIKETIKTTFNVEKHGIYRKIPIVNKVQRLDGTISRNYAKIKNITCNEMYTLIGEVGYKIIKIGDPENTSTGDKTYEIGYTYNLGKDNSKGYDELYFNIIGSEWDTTINGVQFNIEMPKAFDKSKLGFSVGKEGSTENSGISYEVDGNTIKGTYSKTLNPGEGVTIRLELPEGYFVGQSDNFSYLNYLSILIPIVFVVFAAMTWSRYGKDERVIETVEFYPPNSISSAEIGAYYRGFTTQTDVLSLIVYLANKGYIRIEEVETKNILYKSKSFKFIKLKEYDGNDEVEKAFLDGLFKKKTEVTNSDLTDKFYKVIEKVMTIIRNKKIKDEIYDKKASKKMVTVILMLMATFALTIVNLLFKTTPSGVILGILFTTGMIYTAVLLMLSLINNSGVKLVGIIVSLAVVFVGLAYTSLADKQTIYVFIVGLACIAFLSLFASIMSKRTPFGNEILGKIRGFKRFLKYAQKDKLETLVEKDPDYFYDILPYAYVLGVSNKWMKKFETIITEPPRWYSGNEIFNMVAFNTFINSTMTQTSVSAYGGTYSSGGGFSGGGSGGGGGGSW